jgi:hypothetical protein
MDFFTGPGIYKTPRYKPPLFSIFNQDMQSLLLIFVIIWKLYFYFTTDTSLGDEIVSTYDTYQYLVNSINSTINVLFIIIVMLVFLSLFV